MAVRIVVNGVAVYYGAHKALDGVTVEFRPGEVTAVLGPNGSGKTTLLRTILKVVKPRVGAVYLGERDVKSLRESDIARLVGYMSQSIDAKFPLRVWEAVALGRKPYVTWSLSSADMQIIKEAMKLAGVEQFADRYLYELSGGEVQRVMLARVLAQRPRVILLDEPLNNLDPRYQLWIIRLVRELTKREGLTTVAVLHDLNMALRFADYAVLMRDGKIYAVGRPEEVITPENIEAVFGVKAEVVRNPVPHVVLLETL
jgi:iron complex transport system ATP-binding protein